MNLKPLLTLFIGFAIAFIVGFCFIQFIPSFVSVNVTIDYVGFGEITDIQTTWENLNLIGDFFLYSAHISEIGCIVVYFTQRVFNYVEERRNQAEVFHFSLDKSKSRTK